MANIAIKIFQIAEKIRKAVTGHWNRSIEVKAIVIPNRLNQRSEIASQSARYGNSAFLTL